MHWLFLNRDQARAVRIAEAILRPKPHHFANNVVTRFIWTAGKALEAAQRLFA